MRLFRKPIYAMPIFALILSVIISGCSGNEAAGDSEEATGDSQEANQQEEQIKMTMFMSNSGLAHPDGVDPSDNEFINIVEDYANVDLEIEVPNYTDIQTKLNLLLSSGNLPDIVHSTNVGLSDEAGRKGAFIDLKEYYDNSPVVQKVISPDQMELAKDDESGKYFRIPMSAEGLPQGYGNITRYDMIEKYNDGKWPESVDEWVDLLRKIQKAEPDSVLITNRALPDYGIGYGGNVIFQWFGVKPYDYRVQDGKVINEFRTPEYRAAVELMRQLYEEGIIDKEFATTDTTAYAEHLENDNTIMYSNLASQALSASMNSAIQAQEEGTDLKKYVYAPPLKEYPAVVKDVKYTYPKMNIPISGHGLYISSTSKNPDRAWKAIEGFASDELFESIFWGEEGETYTVEDGQRVPNVEKLEADSRSWAIHLGVLFGFNNHTELKRAKAGLVMEPEYLNQVVDSIDQMQPLAEKGGVGVTALIPLREDVAKKAPDSRLHVTEATMEAMMGNITMEQFDERVEKYVQKFGFIDDYYTEYMNEHKDVLREKGAIEVDW